VVKKKEEKGGSAWWKVSVASKRPFCYGNHHQHCKSEWHSALVRPPPTWGGKVLPKPKQNGLSSHGKCLLFPLFFCKSPQTHLYSLLCSAASQACPAATESCCHKPVCDNELDTTTTTTTTTATTAPGSPTLACITKGNQTCK